MVITKYMVIDKCTLSQPCRFHLLASQNSRNEYHVSFLYAFILLVDGKIAQDYPCLEKKFGFLRKVGSRQQSSGFYVEGDYREYFIFLKVMDFGKEDKIFS